MSFALSKFSIKGTSRHSLRDKDDAIFVIMAEDAEKLPSLLEERMRSRTGLNFARSATVKAEEDVREEDRVMVDMN
jgi:hypothetical protein